MQKACWILLFLLFHCHFSYSQSYYFKNYQVEDGLSYNSVLCSMQDSRGFMWFGTKNGLNRFDGYAFKSFTHNPNSVKGMGSNYIFSLAEDRFQDLWVGTSNGLYRYDAVVETFTLIQQTKGKSIIKVIADPKGDVWYILDGVLYKYQVESQQIQDFASNVTSVASITFADGIWVASHEGYIARFSQVTDSFIRYDMYSHSPIPLTKRIPVIQSAGDNTLLIGSQGQGLKVFNTKDFTYQDVLSMNPDQTPIYIRDIMHYQDNEYWLATESGIFIYDLKNGLKKQLRKDRNDPFSLTDNAIYSLTKDREGGVWAGTYFGGVNYYTKENTFFQKVFSRSAGNVLKNNAVRELSMDQYGSMWVGTEDAGLVKYEPATDQFTSFQADGKKGSISHNNIHGLLAIKDELWIGTFEQGLDVMDIKTGKVVRNYKSGSSKLGSNFIESLLLSKEGTLYIGTSSGLYRYQKGQDDFVKIDEIPNNHLHAILEDQQGVLWLATSDDGIYSFNPKNKKVARLNSNPSNPNRLLNDYVNGLAFDSKENLWIASENGLSIYDSKKKTIHHISSSFHFPSNVFYKVLEDEDKNFWISTAKGLIFMSRSLDSWKHFTKSNGLLNDQFNYNSAYKALDGTLYFGSVKGLIRFDPKNHVSTRHNLPVYFTGFQVSNQELSIHAKGSPLTKSILFTNKIVLKPKQSTFSIDFAALSYASPQMTQYAYRMKGVENEWVYLKTNRKVYFTNISAGDYVFEVKASTNDEWADEVSVLHITVNPPFVASNTAFFIYFIIIITAAWLIYKFKMQRLRERTQRKFTLFQNRKEQEIYRAKLQFFTNITHEIRTPLTLIRGPLEAIMQDVDPQGSLNASLGIIKKNTDRLIHLTDQLLNFRKAEAENVTLSFVETDVCSLLDETYQRFLPLANSQHCAFEITLPEEQVRAFIDEEAIKKIVSNLFSNAIKYSNGTILVRLSSDDTENRIKISVMTDGKPIPLELREQIFEPFYRLKESESQSGTGIGLALARALAELHGGKLTLCEPENLMNVFVLEIPKEQNNAYKLFEETLSKPIQRLHSPVPEEDFMIRDAHIDTKLEAVLRPSDKQALTVMIVEDNIDIIDFVSSILADHYHVVYAMNGEEAVLMLKKTTVSLIISDIMMPIMDGYEFCRYLKNELEYSHIPIVLLSAKGSLESKIDGLGAGADAYIEKPFSPQYLLAQLESLLSNREKIRTYFTSSPLVQLKTMAYSAADAQFLEKLNEVIDENIDQTNLDVEQLAWFMNMSRPTLYRKIKAICELSPLELITLTRLKKAAQLLVESDYTIKKIALYVGFSSQTQFTRNFTKQFEVSPSKYRMSKVKEKLKS